MSNKAQMQSMTGYGRGTAEGDGLRVVVELRSINARFLDIRVRMPRPWSLLEAQVKEQLKKYFVRGTIDAAISYERINGVNTVKIDKALANAYAQEIRGLARETGVDSHVSAVALLKLPGVIQESGFSLDEPASMAVATEALTAAIQDVEKMRQSEGAHIASILERELIVLQQCVKNVTKEKSHLNAEAANRLSERITKVLGENGAAPDSPRVLQEVAFYLERSDVTEELDRLTSHIEQFQKDLSKVRPLGKRLDFLLQEMSREVNTLGSKSSKVDLIREVMDLKLALDRMKEQVQNLE